MVKIASEISKVKLPTEDIWQALAESANQIKFGDCWKNCASYCCRTNNQNISFSLMKCNSAGMVFPLEEYRFLEKKNVLQQGFSTTARFHNFEFCAKRNLSLQFVTAVCNLGGLCSIPDYRPLICKLYPHYPIPSPEDGRIRTFVVGSIIDQYWDDLNIEHPCWLHREKGEEVSEAIKYHLEKYFTHPYLIFYFGAASAFVRQVSQIAKVQASEKFKNDPVNFFRNWEIQYLLGKYINVEAYKKECSMLYDRIAGRYGEFKI